MVKGEVDRKLAAIHKTNWPDLHWTHMYKAAARQLELYPDYAEKARGELGIWNFPQESIEHFAEGLSKAGLVIRTD